MVICSLAVLKMSLKMKKKKQKSKQSKCYNKLVAVEGREESKRSDNEIVDFDLVFTG